MGVINEGQNKLITKNVFFKNIIWFVVNVNDMSKSAHAPLLHLILEMHNEKILIQGVPKVWYPLRNC